MKIWEIVKEDFENEKSPIDEGWKEKVMAGALATSMALGGKGMDKPIKAEPSKIEYKSSFGDINPLMIKKVKQDYASFIKNNTPSFDDFRNYDQIIQYISNLDIITQGNKMVVVDEFNNKTPLTLSIQSKEHLDAELKKIFGKYITNYLLRLKEQQIAREFKTHVNDEIQKAFSELTNRY